MAKIVDDKKNQGMVYRDYRRGEGLNAKWQYI